MSLTPTNYPHGTLFLQFLDTVGNGTGSIDMAVNGSITPQEFLMTAPPGHTIYMESISIFIQDNGNLAASGYGAGAALANGIKLELRRTTHTTDVTSQLLIKTNSDWMAYTFGVNTFNFVAGESVLALDYNLNQAGKPLRFSPGESFALIINDDITGLIKHYARVSFVIVPIPGS